MATATGSARARAAAGARRAPPRAVRRGAAPPPASAGRRGALAVALLAASTWGARDARAAPPPRGDVCAYDCEVGDVECEERRAACRRKVRPGDARRGACATPARERPCLPVPDWR